MIQVNGTFTGKSEPRFDRSSVIPTFNDESKNKQRETEIL